MELSEKYFKTAPYKLSYLVNITEKPRELEKTYYIQDKEKKLKRLQDLLNGDTGKELEVTVTNGKPINLEFSKYGIKDYLEYEEYKQWGMFFGVYTEVSRRRKLELEIYIENILNKVPKPNKNNKEERIFYLIDEKYKTHTNVLSTDFENFVFTDEYNNIIFDALQDEIKKVDTPNAENVENAYRKHNKKVIWKSKKSTLGTIFAFLLQNNIIETEQANLARILQENFICKGNNPTFSYNSLYDNLQFKKKDDGLRPQYDTDVDTHIQPLIKYLKSTLK